MRVHAWRDRAGSDSSSTASAVVQYNYDDFSPALFAQYDPANSGVVDAVGFVVFPSFAAAVDEYYSRYEASRAVQAENKTDDVVEKKKLKIEKDQVRAGRCTPLTG